MCCADLFIDDLIRITVVWSLTEVHYEAIRSVLVNMDLNPQLMTIIGYVAVLLMMTVFRELAQDEIAKATTVERRGFTFFRRNDREVKKDREMYKLGVEWFYVEVSVVAGYVLWEGILIL